MEPIIEMTTAGGKIIKVGQQAFINAMYGYVKERWDEDHREVYLGADGEKEFVIRPTNFNHRKK